MVVIVVQACLMQSSVKISGGRGGKMLSARNHAKTIGHSDGSSITCAYMCLKKVVKHDLNRFTVLGIQIVQRGREREREVNACYKRIILTHVRPSEFFPLRPT